LLKNYKELKVWEKSYQLCLEVYRITQEFPKIEIYGLVSQMRRAALSIPSNIAEGYGRKSITEYLRFLYIAYGSVCELETQIMLSGDLGYLKEMPIDLAHKEKLGFYQLGVSYRSCRSTGFYEPVEELPLPETSVEPITDLGQIGL
jgi:four helix bundle protein